MFLHAAVARSDREGPLLTLLHPSRGLVPFGVVVDWDEACLREGERVRLEGRRLMFGESRVVVELEGEGDDLQIGPSPVSLRALRAQLVRLRLPPRTRALLCGDSEDLVVRTASARLAAVVCALFAEDPAASGWPGSALGLIGLGPGSTPTGDDLLAGLAALGHRLAADAVLPETSWRGFLETLEASPRDRTTETAAEMLRHAASGAFPEALLDFATRLGTEGCEAAALQQAADRLAGLGAQTGTDMLAGALSLAARAVGNHGGLS